MEALNLAQDYQTPVFVAMDLDLGMNLWMSPKFQYPTKPLSRGKVLDAAALERLGRFERYRDVDGDGVCYRTLPGTEHPLAAYFTRGTGHNEKSGYSERPDDWKRNIDRLARKLETARAHLPKPVLDDAGLEVGLIACGSSHWAVIEARDQLAELGVPVDYCRIRALPFADEVVAFIERHERVYVVDQNRDGQVCALLHAALPGRLVDRLVSVRHYDGQPIPAFAISRPILEEERPELASTAPEANGATDDDEDAAGSSTSRPVPTAE
jgi:2-oxoglutarate ferredoxin oxidoreductase subunit alpha